MHGRWALAVQVTKNRPGPTAASLAFSAIFVVTVTQFRPFTSGRGPTMLVKKALSAFRENLVHTASLDADIVLPAIIVFGAAALTASATNARRRTWGA